MSAPVSTEIRPVSILLVEDNPGDVRLTSEGLKRLRTPSRVTVARDAEEALDLLGLAPGRRQMVWPSLILLDLNLPGIKGLELLDCLRREPRFSKQTVVILTSSNAPEDMRRARELGADDYLTKPTTFTDLMAMLQRVENRWFGPGQGDSTLPDIEAVQPDRLAEPEQPSISPRTIRVLLVEDNPALAYLVEMQAERIPDFHMVFTNATRLEEAVEFVRESEFDIVLLDLSLPDSCGLDTLKDLRALAPAELPIVVLTGFSAPEIESEALRSGAAGFLAKDKAGREQLLEAVRKAIKH